MAVKNQPYEENGVLTSKASLNAGDEISLTYKGLLVECGADKVFAYVGYGEDWNEKAFIPMAYDGSQFKAELKLTVAGVLNVAFKDSADNWDNNNGVNYTFKVGAKKKAPAKTAGEKKPVEKAKAKTEKAPAKKAAPKAAPKASAKKNASAETKEST